MLKKILKNEKGLTLIELLAVVVILGIIAAIAVPSIGGIIDNTKKDAHVANAQQMISATKIYLTAHPEKTPVNATDSTEITYANLVDGGYVQDKLSDPDASKGTEYSVAKVEVKKAASGQQMVYTVTLTGSKRQIAGKTESELNRDAVTNK